MPIPLPAADLPGAVAPGWDAWAWTGAALYLLLFAGALFGIWRLLGDSPGREVGR